MLIWTGQGENIIVIRNIVCKVDISTGISLLRELTVRVKNIIFAFFIKL